MANTTPKNTNDEIPKSFPEVATTEEAPKQFTGETADADQPGNLPPQDSDDVDNPAAGNPDIQPGDPEAHTGIAAGEDTHPLATGIQDGIAGETEREEAERVAGHNERVARERANQFDTRGSVFEAKALNNGISPKALRVNEQKMERQRELDRAAIAENNRAAEAELKTI